MTWPDSTLAMTNIEAYTGCRERRRVQANFDSVAFGREEDALYLRPRIPDPGLNGCEAYRPNDLSIETGEAQDFQFMLDEDPNLDPRIVELRRLVRERKALIKRYREELTAEYNRLIAKCKVLKTYWHAGPVLHRWRKPWYEKQWVGWRWINQKQFLKPRLIAYREMHLDFETGVKTYEVKRKWIHPFRWVMVRKPKFTWKLKRPGGLAPYKPRVSEKRRVTDWNEVRRLFAAFKLQKVDVRLKILNLRQRSIQIRRTLTGRPKLAASWTTSGYVAPPTISIPVGLPFAGSVYSLGHVIQMGVGRFSFPGFLHDGEYYAQASILCPEALGWGASEAEAVTMAEDHSYVPHTALRTVVVENDRCRMRLGERRSVDLALGGDGLVEAGTADPQKELRAYATLTSLTKASDYTFHLIRSIGELKDSRETFKQARDFLRWLKRPIVKGLTPKKVYAGIAGAYLAWKFAIEPTIQDIKTVTDNTVEYLTDIRRSLRELVVGLTGGTSIYHARAAYASGRGIVSGRVQLHADNASFGEVKYSLNWTRRYVHPLHVFPKFSGPVDFTIDAVGSSDPEHRDVVVQPLGDTRQPSFQATIIEEADDGQQWSRSFPGGASWIYDGDPSLSEQDMAGARIHCHRVQQLSAFATPYTIRDLATGTLFAMYHADEIVQLGTSGRLDLGTITDYMNQIVALESWLKNPDAQRACGKELLRHADVPFVAWQLTPLSFIYDWFTTSGTIVEALNSLSRTALEAIPAPLHGVWQSERHELMAAVPNLRLRSRACHEKVREWTVVEVSRRFSDLRRFYAAPARSTIFYDTVWDPSPGTATFRRTGLYRFRRGEYEPHGLDKLDVYMPRLHLDINADKLVTLSAMIGGFV